MVDNALLDLHRIASGGRRALLVTVVRAVGPSYRPLGSSAVLVEGGGLVGAVSGGCLESDVIAAAEAVFAGGPPQVLSYDTGGDEDLLWGTASGCGGRVDLLIGPVAEGVLAEAAARLRSGRPAVLETVIAPGPDLGDRRLLADASREARSWYSADGTRFCQAIQPPATLLVIGAGNDSQPVVSLAANASFRVVVADHRPAWTTADRFPQADALVVCQLEELLSRTGLGPDSYALLLTHQYARDLESLQVLLGHGVRYIGLLGARQRSKRLIDELLQDRPDLAEPLTASLRAPVGLDIGADGPQEIALSIVAELVAHRAGKLEPYRAGHVRGAST